MAGEGTKRIIDLTEAAETQSGDYIAIDSTGRGTRKLPAGFMATAEDLSEEQTERRTADATLDGKITAEAQARLDADNAIDEQITALDEKTEAAAALIQNPTKTLSGALVSFTDGADMPMVACTASIVPQQSGTGTPSPENVRPISGWESVNVNVAGVNVYSGESQIIIDKPITRGTTIYIQIFDGTFTGSTLYAKTTTADWVGIGAITTTKNAITINRDDILQIKLSSSAYSDLNRSGSKLMASLTDFDAYAPYTGTTTTTSLGRTVYGGTLDVVSGVLTVDRAFFTPTVVRAVAQSGTKYFWTFSLLEPAPTDNNAEVISSHFKTYSGVVEGSCYVTNAGGLLIAVPTDQSLNTKELAEAWLAENNPQFCYLLRIPQTYQLTPTEVNTLLGENNVWADSGDVEITYRRDISIVINNLESALNG